MALDKHSRSHFPKMAIATTYGLVYNTALSYPQPLWIWADLATALANKICQERCCNSLGNSPNWCGSFFFLPLRRQSQWKKCPSHMGSPGKWDATWGDREAKEPQSTRHMGEEEEGDPLAWPTPKCLNSWSMVSWAKLKCCLKPPCFGIVGHAAIEN